MEHWFFNGWEAIGRIIIVGICSYIALLLLLRVAGKRTLSRMNMYDMVVTMALGSILAKVLLSLDVSVSESVTATFLLIALQYAVSVAMCRSQWVRSVISAKPTVLFYNGRYIESALKKERVDKDEIKAAMHEKGIADMVWVEAVILGTNGYLNVLLKPEYVCGATMVSAGKQPGEV